jgi:hypothetical protein
MKVSRAMPLTARTLWDRMNCGLIVRARGMAVSGGLVRKLIYSDYRNKSQCIVAFSDGLSFGDISDRDVAGDRARAFRSSRLPLRACLGALSRRAILRIRARTPGNKRIK